ncbi:MAG: hypothetical protein R3248_00985 [Candidatus Promineifilaceae bacterium]|nr:hypothetical protein [Candidatus Promineifilaceae bacterium]
MLTRQNVLRLLLLGLLLAALLVPVVGAGVAGNVAGALDDAASFQRLIQGDGLTGQPAAIIACDDPGGSGGSGGGC